MRKAPFFVLIFLFLSQISLAATAFPGYQPLTSIPGISSDTSIDAQTGAGLSDYLNNLYKMGVAAAAGLAVIMVIWGGIQYITSAAGEGKSGGKERVTSAILGLLLALGSYIILNTINPDLLTLKFTLDDGPSIATNFNGTVQQQNNLTSQLNDIQNHIDTLNQGIYDAQTAINASTLNYAGTSYNNVGDHSVQKINFSYNADTNTPGTTAIAPAGTYKIGDKVFVQSLQGIETSSLQFSDGIVTITGISQSPNDALKVNMGYKMPDINLQNQPSNVILKQKGQ